MVLLQLLTRIVHLIISPSAPPPLRVRLASWGCMLMPKLMSTISALNAPLLLREVPVRASPGGSHSPLGFIRATEQAAYPFS